MKPIWFALAAAAIPAVPQIADACAPRPCYPGAFVPGNSGRVPANVPGLYWQPTTGVDVVVDPSSVVLASAAEPARPLPFTAQPLDNGHFLLVPDAPLVAGTSYILTDRTVCGLSDEHGPQITFTVDPPASLPSELGALVEAASGVTQRTLPTSNGTCFDQFTVDQATIDLALATGATAWGDALHVETLVDGRPWSRNLGLPVTDGRRGRDTLYHICATDDGFPQWIEAGKHVVTMRAMLPGTTLVWTTTPLEVTLTCDTAPDPEPDPDPSPTEPEPDTADGGCSAAAAAPSSLILGLLALVTLRRRPRRR